jgi:hypothetical protein
MFQILIVAAAASALSLSGMTGCNKDDDSGDSAADDSGYIGARMRAPDDGWRIELDR